MNIARRLEKIEEALMGKYIPKVERLQIIKGISVDGEFIPDAPGDCEETRKRDLLRRFGSVEGVIFIELIDRFETGREL